MEQKHKIRVRHKETTQTHTEEKTSILSEKWHFWDGLTILFIAQPIWINITDNRTKSFLLKKKVRKMIFYLSSGFENVAEIFC